MFNTAMDHWDLDVPVAGFLAEGAALVDVWGGGEATVRDGRLVGLGLPGRSGAVLELRAEPG